MKRITWNDVAGFMLVALLWGGAALACIGLALAVESCKAYAWRRGWEAGAR